MSPRHEVRLAAAILIALVIAVAVLDPLLGLIFAGLAAFIIGSGIVLTKPPSKEKDRTS